MHMKKENYFVGARFNNDKQLFHKIVNNPLRNSELIRKSVYQYFRSKEENKKFDVHGFDHVDNTVVTVLTNQLEFLQKQVEFLQKQNAYLSLPWYKKYVHKLEGKPE